MSSGVQSTSREKICCNCGADLNGQQRLKDDSGQYWCIPCAKKDQAKRGFGKVKCPDCGRMVPENSMIRHELTTVCTRCFKERTEEKKYAVKRTKIEGEFRKYEIQRVKWMLGIALVLIIIALWNVGLLPKWSGGGEKSDVRELIANTLVIAVMFLVLLVGTLIWVKKKL